MAKDKDYNKMIHSSRWVKLRRSVLSGEPLCRRCKAQGFITLAVELHHIIPVEEGLTIADKERLMFNPSNLMPLCHRCHVDIHIELGRGGKEANVRRTGKKLEEFKKSFTADTGG